MTKCIFLFFCLPLLLLMSLTILPLPVLSASSKKHSSKKGTPSEGGGKPHSSPHSHRKVDNKRLHHKAYYKYNWRDLRDLRMNISSGMHEQLKDADVFEPPGIPSKEILKDQPVYVSLATIRARLPFIAESIRSILNGTIIPTQIFLILSEGPYLFDTGVQVSELPLELLALTKTKLLTIVFAENIGPHRKLLPVLSKFWHQDCVIITMDDDREPEFLHTAVARLMEYYLASGKESVIGLRVRRLGFCNTQSWSLAEYSLCNWPQIDNGRTEMLVMPTGSGSILYRPRFFKDVVFDPQLTLLSATNDDIAFRLVTMSKNIFVVLGCCDVKHPCWIPATDPVDNTAYPTPAPIRLADTQKVRLWEANRESNRNGIMWTNSAKYLESIGAFNFTNHVLQFLEKERAYCTLPTFTDPRYECAIEGICLPAGTNPDPSQPAFPITFPQNEGYDPSSSSSSTYLSNGNEANSDTSMEIASTAADTHFVSSGQNAYDPTRNVNLQHPVDRNVASMASASSAVVVSQNSYDGGFQEGGGRQNSLNAAGTAEQEEQQDVGVGAAAQIFDSAEQDEKPKYRVNDESQSQTSFQPESEGGQTFSQDTNLVVPNPRQAQAQMMMGQRVQNGFPQSAGNGRGRAHQSQSQFQQTPRQGVRQTALQQDYSLSSSSSAYSMGINSRSNNINNENSYSNSNGNNNFNGNNNLNKNFDGNGNLPARQREIARPRSRKQQQQEAYESMVMGQEESFAVN